jgi:membrane protein required for colicin V production
MNPFDVLLLALALMLTLAGAIWGATRILAGMVGFAVAFLLGLRLADRGPDWFGAWIAEPEWARLAAFSVVFLGVALAAAIAAFVLRRFLQTVMLGWADRLAGAGVGLAMALLASVALLVPLTALPPEDRPVLEDSVLAPWALGVAGWLGGLVPGEIAERFGEKAEALRRSWEERDGEEDEDGPQR